MEKYKIFENKRLLITGGTGSFGNAVVKALAQGNVREIRIFSRDEKKQDEMRHHYKDVRLKFFIGDVRNIGSLREAANGVDFVFHAAALKQVPSCEFFPMEAVKTNVEGTDNVLRVAIEQKIKRVVVLSTDKAAYPINAMGISKAMMEKVAIARSRLASEHGVVICVTRYGNVMASRGSVIPLFIAQIKKGEALTATNPAMTRFMMSLDDAVKLVIYAFEHANSGDLFVQKAPAADVGTLIAALKRVFNVNPAVKIIGTRHGEKLYETLLTREERDAARDLGDYFSVPADNRDLNYDLYFSEGTEIATESRDYNSENTRRLNVDEMADLLLGLPEVQTALIGKGVAD
jgi:UDP-N-acetylglucosamine 4,6-dehydratase/5-epimerase